VLGPGLETLTATHHDGWDLALPSGVEARDLLALVEAGGGELKSSAASSVVRARLGADEVVVKRFRWRGLRRALGEKLYGSRVARSLEGAARVRALGLSTPAVVAVAERRSLGLVREGVLVTRFLGEARSLPEELRRLDGAPRRARRIASSLGRAIGALHAAGVHHPDLKASNLLVLPDLSIAFVDLDCLVPPRPLSWERRVRALGQLEAYARYLAPWVCGSTRAAFLAAYARTTDLRGAPEKVAELAGGADAWATAKVRTWEGRIGTLPPDKLPPLPAEAL
jgi:tRNA A-37 threonylcarbamoyl transferase component Bud32